MTTFRISGGHLSGIFRCHTLCSWAQAVHTFDHRLEQCGLFHSDHSSAHSPATDPSCCPHGKSIPIASDCSARGLHRHRLPRPAPGVRENCGSRSGRTMKERASHNEAINQSCDAESLPARGRVVVLRSTTAGTHEFSGRGVLPLCGFLRRFDCGAYSVDFSCRCRRISWICPRDWLAAHIVSVKQ